VVRWALNAIALIGTKADHLQATLDAVERHRDDEDILGAGVAAVVALTQPPDVGTFLKTLNVPLEGAPLLAAAQQSNIFASSLTVQRFNLSNTDPPELRLATLLVGLGKAPDNLFELRFDNAHSIGILNTHDDAQVAQYSVWAIVENPSLGLGDLRIPLADIEARPENVRGWVYQLIAADAGDAEKHRELVKLGSADRGSKARHGLATGLRASYFPGLEDITIDWLGTELDPEIKATLLDHMGAYSERCPIYREAVVSAYTLAGVGSLTRVRLETSTRGTPVYAELKRRNLEYEMSLFGTDERAMINITGGQINIGSVAGRDANVSGDINVSQTIDNIQEQLSKLEKLLGTTTEPGLAAGVSLVTEAKADPTKSRINKILEWMKSIKDAGGYIAAGMGSFEQIHHTLLQLSNNIPS